MVNVIFKKFSKKDLKNFKNKSGDNNQIHYRVNNDDDLPFNEPIVYAALILKFILKKILKNNLDFDEINAMFIKPVFLNEKLIFYIKKKRNSIEINLSNGIFKKASIILKINKKLKKVENSIINTNLMLLSKFVGNYKNQINLISFINIKNYCIEKKKSKFTKISDKLYKLSFNFKSLKNSIYFISNSKKYIQKKFSLSNKKKSIDKKILIIGGSSGLGIETYNYLKLKGYNPEITYNNLNKTNNMEKLIKKNIAYKLNDKSLEKNIKMVKKYEIIFFFVTPKIFNESRKIFDLSLLNSFNLIYINFFYRIVKNLLFSKKKYKILIPSSSILQKPEDNLEYAMAKKNLEFFIRIINKNSKNISVNYPRLEAFNTINTKYFLNVNKSYNKLYEEIDKIL